jgi:hypothetical protein
VEEIGNLLDHLGYATPLLYAAAAYGLFHWLDENASDEAKAALASTMKLRQMQSKDIASALVEVFDRIYSHPLLSWRSISRSVSYTLAVTVVYCFEYLDLGTSLKELWTGDFGYLGLGRIALHMTWALILMNIVTDYISLFFIRPCLINAGERPVTALLSGAYYGVWVVAMGIVARTLIVSMIFNVWSIEMLFEFSKMSVVTVVPAILVFGWLPLFALGILTIRTLMPLSWTVEKVMWGLEDGSAHPLRAIAAVAAVAVLVVGVGAHAFETHNKSAPKADTTESPN